MQIGQYSKIISKDAPPADLPLETIFTLPPLHIRWERPQRSCTTADANVYIAFEGYEERFLAEYKPAWNHRTFAGIIDQSRHHVAASPERGLHPLVILPYLSEEHISELVDRKVSGLDLCGNGVVIIPGRWLIQRSGRLNRYRIEQDLRNPYKGLASLVARTLLRKPEFQKLDDLYTEIHRRGGKLSLALASRSLKRLEEEILVQSAPGQRVRLVQPDRLLNQLVKQAETKMIRKWIGRIALPTAEFLPKVFSNAMMHRVRAVMTGIGSTVRHAVMSMEDVAYIYAEDVDILLEGLPVKPGERFANLEIYVPRDEVVYFDTEQDEKGIVWASPVQTYLEMMHSTDSRLHEGAKQLRKSLLHAIVQQEAVL